MSPFFRLPTKAAAAAATAWTWTRGGGRQIIN